MFDYAITISYVVLVSAAALLLRMGLPDPEHWTFWK
jgi:hypothetical protein